MSLKDGKDNAHQARPRRPLLRLKRSTWFVVLIVVCFATYTLHRRYDISPFATSPTTTQYDVTLPVMSHLPFQSPSVHTSVTPSKWLSTFLNSLEEPHQKYRFTVPYSRELDAVEGEDTFLTIGKSAQVMQVWVEDVPDWHIARGREGDTVLPNRPSLLRLPAGLQWQYIVATQGRRAREDIPIKDDKQKQKIMSERGRFLEDNIIVFGANVTAGNITVASWPVPLDITAPVQSNCGEDMNIFGAQDARLMWSDDARPTMTLTRTSVMGRSCRSMAVLPDLRVLWPELSEILEPAEPHIPPVNKLPHAHSVVDLQWNQHQDLIETDWMPFYPGAKADRKRQVPFFHRSPSAGHVLVPSREPSEEYPRPQVRTVIPFHTAESASVQSRFCAQLEHPFIPTFAHGTPLYRLTLCPRGTCRPNIDNTVALTLSRAIVPGQDKSFSGRYFALWNVTAPYTQLAVGPLARYPHTQFAALDYTGAIAFSPKVALKDPEAEFAGGLSPSHGFLDDLAWFSYSVENAAIGFVNSSVSKLLTGLHRCELP